MTLSPEAMALSARYAEQHAAESHAQGAHVAGEYPVDEEPRPIGPIIASLWEEYALTELCGERVTRAVLGRFFGRIAGTIGDMVFPDRLNEGENARLEEMRQRWIREELSSRADRCIECGACSDGAAHSCGMGVLN